MNREQYLLTCLAEECTEAAKCALKAIRFGLQPSRARPEEWREFSNQKDLEIELGDILTLIEMLGVFPSSDRANKTKKVEQWMEISKRLGIIDE